MSNREFKGWASLPKVVTKWSQIKGPVESIYMELTGASGSDPVSIDPQNPSYSIVLDNVSFRILGEKDFEYAYHRGDPKDKREAHRTNAFMIRGDNGREPRVYLKQGDLASSIINAGHEIGHLLTENLGSEWEEEVKAYGFEDQFREYLLRRMSLRDPSGINLTARRRLQSKVHSEADEFLTFLKNEGYSAKEIFYGVIFGTI